MGDEGGDKQENKRGADLIGGIKAAGLNLHDQWVVSGDRKACQVLKRDITRRESVPAAAMDSFYRLGTNVPPRSLHTPRERRLFREGKGGAVFTCARKTFSRGEMHRAHLQNVQESVGELYTRCKLLQMSPRHFFFFFFSIPHFSSRTNWVLISSS